MFQAWILTLLLALSPTPPKYAFPGWAETKEEHVDRLSGIAGSIARATNSASDAAALVSLAVLESGLEKSVDVGPCYRGPLGTNARCDNGHAYSIWQLHVTSTLNADDLGNRDIAAKQALRAVRWSLGACGGGDHGLDLYAGGHCGKAGSEISTKGKARLDLARKLLRQHPPPKG